jgi:tryptophan synthase beta chain
LKDIGRVRYVAATDEEALAAFRKVSLLEGLIPAFETAHAFAALFQPNLFAEGSRVLVCMSGRGDKDMVAASKLLNL